MQASRILPDLQCSLLCEDIKQEVNGNLILIGVISLIRVPQLPIVAGRLLVFNRWTAGVGQVPGSVRQVATDLTTVICRGESKFELRSPADSATPVMVFTNVEFKNDGVYFIEVLVDEVMKLRYPLPVIVTPLPNQNPAPRA
jgi:hypothetical protein